MFDEGRKKKPLTSFKCHQTTKTIDLFKFCRCPFYCLYLCLWGKCKAYLCVCGLNYGAFTIHVNLRYTTKMLYISLGDRKQNAKLFRSVFGLFRFFLFIVHILSFIVFAFIMCGIFRAQGIQNVFLLVAVKCCTRMQVSRTHIFRLRVSST